jgi:hypothetical protein
MKEYSQCGPITVGANCPTTPKAMDESSEGTVMNPGNTKGTFTSRTASKFKSFKREPVPKTPMGSGGGESMP